MKNIKIDLPKELKGVELHTFSDWHIGDAQCDMAHIREAISRVQNTNCAYCILNGDLCNTALKTSVSDIYSETMPIMEQINTLCELLTPIKDKILAITTGNHEGRAYKTDGVDIMRIVARQLGVEDRYASEGLTLFLRFGEVKKYHTKGQKQAYAIYITHGTGGGRKVGSKANRLEDLAGIVDADVFIHSHTHLPLIFKQSFYRIHWAKSSTALVERLFVNASASLNYGGYGQTAGFKPSSKSNPVVYLNGTKREMGARL